MLKRFEIKTYTFGWVLKHTIAPNIVMSEISFSQTMNWGQWQLVIKLDAAFNTTDYLVGDLIRIWEYDENEKSGRKIYYGFVSKIWRVQDTSSEYIELVCLWIGWLLNDVLFYYTGVYNPTINDDPANIIKAAIDFFNTMYSWTLISYAWWHIDTYWTSVNLSYSYQSCFSVIKKAVDTTDYWRYIDADGEFWFKAKPATATHSLTMQKNVEKIILKEDLETMVNKYYLSWSWGATGQYADMTSVWLYWRREKTGSATEAADSAARDALWNSYLAENKDAKSDISIVVNSKYDIETIKPGDTIKVMNIDYTIDNIQVLKTNYKIDNMILSLDKLVTFGDEVIG